MEICPSCGLALDFKPWDGDDASFEICPHCKIQFGYDDAAGGSEEARENIYKLWNEAWLANDKKPLTKDQEKEVIAKATQI